MPTGKLRVGSARPRGSILVLALLLVLIFVILGFTIVSMQGLEGRQASQAEYSTRALYMADAGVQFALAGLGNQNPYWRKICPNASDPCCCPQFGTLCPGGSCVDTPECPSRSLNPCTLTETKWIYSEGFVEYGFTADIENFSSAEFTSCINDAQTRCYVVRSSGTIRNAGLNPAQILSQRVLKAYIRLNWQSGNYYDDPPTTAEIVAQYEDFK